MRRAPLFVFVMPLLLSCAGTDTVEPVNRPPSIDFTFEPVVVDFRRSATLTVAVSDADGDPLSVTWEITSGTLSGSSKTEKQWDPPASVGVDTVTVRVSDGEASDTVVEILKRGTRNTAADLPSFTFTKDQSPWLLEPPVETIRWSGDIVIEPGVELYIAKPTLSIELVGTLESIGTPSDTILIRPNDRTVRCAEQRGWWEGFRLVADGPQVGQVDMAYTHVSYGNKNLWVWQGSSSARLRYSRFVCGGEAGIQMGSAGSLLVDHCDISDNKTHGIAVSSLSTVPDSVTITHNLIKSNDHTGISMNLQDPTQSAVITIERNEIKLNSVHGISLTNAVWATIRHNDLQLNNLSNVSNIWLGTPFPAVGGNFEDWDTLLATHNFWGRAYDPGEIGLIEQTIEDKSDNPALGTYVIVAPWEDTPQSGP